MLVSEEALAAAKTDPISAIVQICEAISRHLEETADQGNEWTRKDYDLLIEAYAFIESLIDAGLLEPLSPPLALGGTMADDCRNINGFLKDTGNLLEAESRRLKLQTFKNRFNMELGTKFFYEFSQGDVDRIQILVNELRENISKSAHFEKDHQQRLLARLEKLQSEIHKKMSDIDKFWGLVGDAGVVLGKLGKDAKPIVDRVKEIADIVWRTQSRAEELPSGTKTPLLEESSED